MAIIRKNHLVSLDAQLCTLPPFNALVTLAARHRMYFLSDKSLETRPQLFKNLIM